MSDDSIETGDVTQDDPLVEMTKDELLAEAEAVGVVVSTRMTKAEVIEAIQAVAAPPPPAPYVPQPGEIPYEIDGVFVPHHVYVEHVARQKRDAAAARWAEEHDGLEQAAYDAAAAAEQAEADNQGVSNG